MYVSGELSGWSERVYLQMSAVDHGLNLQRRANTNEWNESFEKFARISQRRGDINNICIREGGKGNKMHLCICETTY